MNDDIARIVERLSSRRVLERKAAIRELKEHLEGGSSCIARLSLHYVSEHDPSFTVRNIAKQAFYRIRAPPPSAGTWEKAYLFHKE